MVVKKNGKSKEERTMKKMMTNMKTLVALLMAGAAVTSCSSDNTISDQPVQQPAGLQVYTMTVEATKGGDGTRSLADGGTTLTSTWSAGDKVKVYNSSDTELGELTAQSDGASTTLTGTLTTKPNNNETLTLKYLSPNYSQQDGTLTGTDNSIDKKCDYATATVTATVEGDNVTTDAATFQHQQAVVKFTLQDKGNSNAAISPSALTINDGTDDIVSLTSIPDATYTTNGTGVLYVAIPGFSDKTITLTATVGSDTYTLSTSSAKTFANGSYYRITAQMAKQVTTASTLSALKTAIINGTDCSSYVGWQVNSNGDIAESNVSGTKIGYVGYVSTSDVDTGVSGSRILVLASADASTGRAWGTYGTSRSLTTDGMTGYSYTNTLQGYGSSAHPAAYAAWTYSATIPGGGATPAHWFLPTKAQLSAIVSALGGYSTFKTKVGWSSEEYLSSTEKNSTNAWHLGKSGAWLSNGKTASWYYVRSCFAY